MCRYAYTEEGTTDQPTQFKQGSANKGKCQFIPREQMNRYPIGRASLFAQACRSEYSGYYRLHVASHPGQPTEALPGVLGNKGTMPLITGKRGNKSLNMKGTGEQRQFWGKGNIENQNFDWGDIGLIVLGFLDTSTLVGHFVSSLREREKRDRRDSRREEREGQGRKRNRNESEETEK